MDLVAARLLATVIEAYCTVGVVFALLFLPRGARTVDPRLAHSPVTVRLVIAPGVAVLWPLFTWRWLRRSAVPDERNPHRDGARRQESKVGAPDQQASHHGPDGELTS